MINEDDYFAVMYSVQNEYRDLINASAELVRSLCDGCKWDSCSNMDFCIFTKNLAVILQQFDVNLNKKYKD